MGELAVIFGLFADRAGNCQCEWVLRSNYYDEEFKNKNWDDFNFEQLVFDNNKLNFCNY